MTRSPLPFRRCAAPMWAMLLLAAGLWMAHPVAHAGEATHGASHVCSLCVSGVEAPEDGAPVVIEVVESVEIAALPKSDLPREIVLVVQTAPRGPPAV